MTVVRQESEPIDPRLGAVKTYVEIESEWGSDEMNIPLNDIHRWSEALNLLDAAYIEYLESPQRHDEEPPAWVQEAIRSGIDLGSLLPAVRSAEVEAQ